MIHRFTSLFVAATVSLGADGPATKFELRIPGVTNYSIPAGATIELSRAPVQKVQQRMDGLTDLEFSLPNPLASRVRHGALKVRFDGEAATATPFETGKGLIVRAHRKNRSKVFTDLERMSVEIYSASQISANELASKWEIELVDEPFIRIASGSVGGLPLSLKLDEPAITPVLGGSSGSVRVKGQVRRPHTMRQLRVGGADVPLDRTLPVSLFQMDVPVAADATEIVIEGRGEGAVVAIIVPIARL